MKGVHKKIVCVEEQPEQSLKERNFNYFPSDIVLVVPFKRKRKISLAGGVGSNVICAGNGEDLISAGSASEDEYCYGGLNGQDDIDGVEGSDTISFVKGSQSISALILKRVM